MHSSWFSKQWQFSKQDMRKGNLPELDLAFDSRLLRTICENEDEATHELGSPVAEVLKHRLADLRAALSVQDLLVGHPRIINGGTYDQHMVLELIDGFQIFFCANHPDNPVTKNNKIDWTKVSRIKILRIERNYV